jgi:histidine triad (HIT) family protein
MVIMEDCIFCKIVSGEIPKDFRFEDEKVLAFDDINPVAPVHVLFIPKSHVKAFEELTDDAVLSSVRVGIQKVVEEEGLVGKGYKIVVNAGGGQVIDHLHFHLFGPVGVHVPVE